MAELLDHYRFRRALITAQICHFINLSYKRFFLIAQSIPTRRAQEYISAPG
jgi:hypothetical protein